MYKLILSIIIFRIVTLSSYGLPKVPSDKPKLIVVVVVEQMRYDYLNKFGKNFGKGGFNRLLSEGTQCVNARHDYLLTQQLPGYATIVTGATPSMHGITGDKWYRRVNNEEKPACVDINVKPISSKGAGGNYSPRDILTTTISDEIGLSNNHLSKIHSVAFDGRAAVIAGGHSADGAWWFDIYSGNWVSSSYYCDSLPEWVNEFNAKKLPEIYTSRQWTPQNALEKYSAWLNKKIKFDKLGFLYDLLDQKSYSQSYKSLTRTPFGNTFTFDFAKQVIVNDSLGRDIYPDFLAIGLNPIGQINQEKGPLSVELEDSYIRLNDDINQFINFLDSEIGLSDVLLILTSDRGCPYSPTYLKQMNLPTGIFDQSQLHALSKSYLNAIYGSGEWIVSYSDKQFYLNHTLIEDAKISLLDMQERLVRFSLQFSGVVNAVSAGALQATNFSNGSFSLIQKSFHQNRSGDVIINLAPGWIEKTDNVVQSNSGYDYDTHVPLIWFGWKVPRTTVYRNISTTSIAATIAAMLDIANPGGASGEVIGELMQKSR